MRDAKGTTNTVSAFSDRFLWSMETISTQCRGCCSSRRATQISPRRGAANVLRRSFGIEVDL
jgi:hypothetical protein